MNSMIFLDLPNLSHITFGYGAFNDCSFRFQGMDILNSEYV